jgi:hypothetical protein
MALDKVEVVTDLVAMHANGDSNMDTRNEYIFFYGHRYVLLMLGTPCDALPSSSLDSR